MYSKEEINRSGKPLALLKALLMGYTWDNGKGYDFEIINGGKGPELAVVSHEVSGEKVWLPYPLPLSTFLKQASAMSDRDYADVCMFITKNTVRGCTTGRHPSRGA